MERASINISELNRLQEQIDKPKPLTADQVQDYALACLVVLRGLSRGEKLRVLTRMRRILG